MTKTCNVPECDEPSRTRNVCNKHYLAWQKIQADVEYILPYVKVITKPIKACSHPRVGENLVNYKIKGRWVGTRCRQCYNKNNRASRARAKEKQKKEETT